MQEAAIQNREKKRKEKARDLNRSEVTITNYRSANKVAKRAVAIVKSIASKDLHGVKKGRRARKKSNKKSKEEKLEIPRCIPREVNEK